MLTDLFLKIKSCLKANQRDFYLAALVFLMSVGSFGLGRLSAIWPVKEPIVIDRPKDERLAPNAPPRSNAPSSFSVSPSSAGGFVASRNGSSYHLPDCPGAKQIKEENKVWFKTEAEAKAAGYKPAGNCPGL